MKKILQIFVQLAILLIVVELSASYYVSGEVEHKFREWNNFIADNSLTNSEIMSYDKGLFRSEAVTRIKAKTKGAEEKVIQIKHIISNGPIIFSIFKGNSLDFQLASIESQPIEQLSSIEIPFVAKTVFNYQGDIESCIEGTAFNIKHELVEFSGQPWKSHFELTKKLLELKGNITFPEITVSIMGTGFSIKNIEVAYDQKRSLFGNWLGDVAFGFDELNEQKTQAKIVGFKFSEGSALIEELVNMAWDLDFTKAVFANIEYGPLQVKLSTENIDPEALHELSKLQTLSKERQQEIYRKFLIKKPRFMIEHVDFMVPQGPIHLEAEFTIGGNNISPPIQPDILEKTINGNFYLTLPKELLRLGFTMGFQSQLAKDPEYVKMDINRRKEALDKQIDLKIQKLKEVGILNENDKAYEIRIYIIGGKWMANGKEITKSSILNIPNNPTTGNPAVDNPSTSNPAANNAPINNPSTGNSAVVSPSMDNPSTSNTPQN